MMDARWVEVDDDIGKSLDHFRNSLALHDEGGFDGLSLQAYRNRMALMHSMQSAYTSFESALERLLEIMEEKKPVGGDYHAAHLRRFGKPLNGSRPALLTDELFRAVDEARRFRHVALKSYDDLEMDRVEPVIEAARVIVARLENVVSSFKAALDQKLSERSRR